MTNIKRKQSTCRCEAYSFPHRQDSKACRELYNESHESGYEANSIDSLGLRGLFAPDNSHLIRIV